MWRDEPVIALITRDGARLIGQVDAAQAPLDD